MELEQSRHHNTCSRCDGALQHEGGAACHPSTSFSNQKNAVTLVEPVFKKRIKCSRACKPCRDAKRGCGSMRPCIRCTKKGIEHMCSPETTRHPKTQPATPEPRTDSAAEPHAHGAAASLCSRFQSRQKVSISCVPCRLSKKGCDPGEPCSRCRIRGIVDQCVRPLRKRAQVALEQPQRQKEKGAIKACPQKFESLWNLAHEVLAHHVSK